MYKKEHYIYVFLCLCSSLNWVLIISSIKSYKKCPLNENPLKLTIKKPSYTQKVTILIHSYQIDYLNTMGHEPS